MKSFCHFVFLFRYGGFSLGARSTQVLPPANEIDDAIERVRKIFEIKEVSKNLQQPLKRWIISRILSLNFSGSCCWSIPRHFVWFYQWIGHQKQREGETDKSMDAEDSRGSECDRSFFYRSGSIIKAGTVSEHSSTWSITASWEQICLKGKTPASLGSEPSTTPWT